MPTLWADEYISSDGHGRGVSVFAQDHLHGEINKGLVLILAGALFYGTVTFQKILVSKFTVP